MSENAVAKKDTSLSGIINSESMKSQWQMVLPQCLTADRLARVALTQLRKNQRLNDCTQGSFLTAMMTCAELEAWTRTNYGSAILKYGYHIQLAFYLAVINKIRKDEGKEPVRHFLFVVVEKSAPYDCAVVAIDERTFALAQTQVKHHLGKLSKCFETGEWLGYKDRGVIVSGIADNICGALEQEIFEEKTYENPANWA